MLSLHSMDSAAGKAFFSHRVEIQSSMSFKIFFLAYCKVMGFSSLDLGPLQISLSSFLFSTTPKYLVKILPWSLSTTL